MPCNNHGAAEDSSRAHINAQYDTIQALRAELEHTRRTLTEERDKWELLFCKAGHLLAHIAFHEHDALRHTITEHTSGGKADAMVVEVLSAYEAHRKEDLEQALATFMETNPGDTEGRDRLLYALSWFETGDQPDAYKAMIDRNWEK